MKDKIINQLELMLRDLKDSNADDKIIMCIIVGSAYFQEIEKTVTTKLKELAKEQAIKDLT